MIQSQAQQNLGRAMNALQDFMIRKLLIPKVYLDTAWNGIPVSVLAIDRAGSGDVHVAWMEFLQPGIDINAACSLLNNKLPRSMEEIKTLPSHYRYVALVSDHPYMGNFTPRDESMRKWLADDGVGRVGILYVDLSEDDPKLQVRVILRAERFRSSKEIVELADRFVAENTANWEFRE